MVTVQRLLGHSYLDTAKEYLNPDVDLMSTNVNRSHLPGLWDKSNS